MKDSSSIVTRYFPMSSHPQETLAEWIGKTEARLHALEAFLAITYIANPSPYYTKARE